MPRAFFAEIETRSDGFHNQVLITSYRYSQMIVLGGMLIVERSYIMPDVIVANQGEQPETEIWLDPGLGEQ